MTDDGVALTSAKHPEDPETIERLCRAICKVYDINPDIESVGLGYTVPKDQRYKLWEAQRKTVQAVLDELAKIHDEMQFSEGSLETMKVEVPRRFVATSDYVPLKEATRHITVYQAGEIIEIDVRPGETLADAMVRQGILL